MNIATPLWVLLTLFFLFLVTCVFLILLIFKLRSKYNTDTAIYIDKTNRWLVEEGNFSGKDKLDYKGKAYFLVEGSGLINKRGKALYIFSEGKPQPLKLDYNTSKWLDSKSLMAIINNQLVRQIVQPSDTAKDRFLMLGAIGGIIAGVCSVVVLAKTLGIF